jgi:DNA end-binding protein Ku
MKRTKQPDRKRSRSKSSQTKSSRSKRSQTKRSQTKRSAAKRSQTKRSGRSDAKQPPAESGAGVSSRPFWSGTITFGLVSIPVDLYPANRSGGVSLRMLGPSGSPLQREYYSEDGKRPLDDDDIVRGYEYAKGKFVVVTDEELERLAPDKSRDIELKRFVPEEDVDPLYFERGYFLAPAGRSRKAYDLLAESMADAGRAGIATFVMREKEYLVAVFAENGILRAETLRFSDEVRSPDSVGLTGKPKVEAARVRAFERIISKSSKRELPARLLEDTRARQLAKLAEQKMSRNEDVVEVEAEARDEGGAEVVDLMAVLRKSLTKSGTTRGRKKRAA